MGKHDDDDSDDNMTFAPDLPCGIVKELVKRAESDQFGRPRQFDEVTIHYVAKADGIEFASTRDANAPLTFLLGKERAIHGLELAVLTMRRREISSFSMDRQFTESKDSIQPSNIPETGALTFEIELMDYVYRRDLFGDGGVLKRSIKAGSGHTKPKLDDEVIISYKVTGADGTVIEERPSFEYRLGSSILGAFGKTVDKALGRLKREGVALLECSQAYACGPEKANGCACTIELCLEELYVTEDVSWFKNGNLMKKCIRQGDDNKGPEEADNVRLMVESATDGNEVLPGFVGPTVLEFNWGDGEIAEAFEAATRKMSRSERAILTCATPRMCCEERLGLSEIKAKKVVFTIELLSVQEDTLEILAPDKESKLEFAEARKDVGARLFKEQRYLMAYYRYEWVVKFLYEKFDRKGELKDRLENLVTACQLNQAACLLKGNDFGSTIGICTNVLERQPSNVKALFRRASAYHSKKEHMLAVRDLTKAVEVEPQNAEARKLLQQAKLAQREEDKSSKSMFAKMIPQDKTEATPTNAENA